MDSENPEPVFRPWLVFENQIKILIFDNFYLMCG
jgi:hypothetical protein